jgi:CheY-like chemotaxis protein
MRGLSSAIHVMVVDDDADGLAALAEALRDAGYQVTTAHDGSDALAQLRAAPELPDVLLTDLVMPQLDGWALAQEICGDAVLGRMRIVVMTASGPRAMASVRAASGCVAKPVIVEQLLAVIDQAMMTRPRPAPRWKSGARPRAAVVDSIDGAEPVPARPPRAAKGRR